MDDINTRLRETSAQCQAALENWNKDKKDVKAREALRDSVHELRKVASRLEIDMAASERDEMAKKPIPIPAHRDAGRKIKDTEKGGPGHKSSGKPRGARKPAPKKAAGGEE